MFLLHKSLNILSLFVFNLAIQGWIRVAMGLRCKSLSSKRLAVRHSRCQYVFIYFQVYHMYLKDVSVANYSAVRLLNFSMKISPSNLGSQKPSSAFHFQVSLLKWMQQNLNLITHFMFSVPSFYLCAVYPDIIRCFWILFINCNFSFSFSFYLKW